jgi:hypothetical protein
MHRSLGETAEAVMACRAALGKEPRQIQWRFELAELLHSQGKRRPALRELQTVLNLQPANAGARELLHVVTRELVENGEPDDQPNPRP